MPFSSLHRRYDGPVPYWEINQTIRPLLKRLTEFHRARALDAVHQLLRELKFSASCSGDLSLTHWFNASHLLKRYQTERKAHKRLVISV